MMNNLEQFIKSNRDQFDSKEPREKLWTQIETDLDGSKNNYGWLWKAAVIVLLVVSGYLMWERSQVQQVESTLASELYVAPELIESELYYTQLITEKRSVVEKYDLDNQGIKEEFAKDIASLDTMYLELKEEFISTGNEAVLDALIRNLQLRMELLDQELMILKKFENDNHDETIETKHL